MDSIETTSQLGWIDFSSTDRERVSQVLALLQEPGTQDELGIGRMRDAFADLLFPGFSTIQTRARYLIFTARLLREYQSLPHRVRQRQPLQTWLADQENRIAKILTEHHDSLAEESDQTGIIGARNARRGQGVARHPSSIYWGALRQFRIVETALSLNEFGKKLMVIPDRHQKDHDDDSDDSHSRRPVIHLPDLNTEWREQLSIHLTASEGAFLHQKLLQHSPRDTITSQLLQHNLLAAALEENSGNFNQLALWLTEQSTVSRRCKRRIQQALAFNASVKQAYCLLNQMLAQKAGNNDLEEEARLSWESQYEHCRQLLLESPFDDWAESTGPGKDPLRFIENWHNAVTTGAPEHRLRELVERQSKNNKKKRSIFHQSLAGLDDWYGVKDGLSYRWHVARQIMEDIEVAQS